MGLFRRSATLPGKAAGGGGVIKYATDGRDTLRNDPDGWEVDQPWLWWLGPAGGDGTGGPFGNPLKGGDPAEQTIATLPGARRATSLIVDTLAGLPWSVMRDTATNADEPRRGLDAGAEQIATPAWLEDPQALRIDGRMIDPATVTAIRLSAVEFWANWITAALWHGNGYVYAPVRDSSGAPKPPLWQLHPHDVAIAGGRYWVGDIELPVDSIIHLRGEPPYLDGYGTGVIDTAGLDLGLAATVRSYAQGVFTSGVPAGYLKSSAPSMTPDDALELKNKWLAQHGGSKRSIAILNATTDFHAVSISPVDAQLVAAKESSLRDIALAFGVPVYMLGVAGDSSTYANVESRMTELRTFTLLPWQRRIESTLDAQFPRGTSLKIRSDALLRSDTAARYAAYESALRAGWLTIDEVRALEDRGPLVAQAPPIA